MNKRSMLSFSIFHRPLDLFIPEVSTWLVDSGLNFVPDLASAEVTGLSHRVRLHGAADSKLRVSKRDGKEERAGRLMNTAYTFPLRFPPGHLALVP